MDDAKASYYSELDSKNATQTFEFLNHCLNDRFLIELLTIIVNNHTLPVGKTFFKFKMKKVICNIVYQEF